MKTELSGKQVIASGVVVAHAGDEINIYPFEDDPKYKIFVLLDFSEDSVPSRVKFDEDEGDESTSLIRFGDYPLDTRMI